MSKPSNVGPLPDATDVGRHVSTDELKELENVCHYVIAFDFWGTVVRLWCHSEEEVDDWRFFYKYFYCHEPRLVHFDLFLHMPSRGNFIRSIFNKDGVKKTMVLRDQDRHACVWSSFNRWSSVASPIPPFGLEPLCHQVNVVQAGSVCSNDGRGLLFVAPPYQGKSTLVNAIVERGGSPLADNVTVIERDGSQKILPYLTPSGIREETVSCLEPAQEAIKRMDRPFHTISEVTGCVWLLHFDQLYPEARTAVATPLTHVVFLRSERHVMGRKFTVDEVPMDLAMRGLEQRRVVHTDDDKEWSHSMEKCLRGSRLLTLRYDLHNCNLDSVIQAILNKS